MPSNSVTIGWDAPPMKEQHPSLSDHDAAHFDEDGRAITRLVIRGLITPSQRLSAHKKLTRAVERALKAQAGGGK